MPDAATAFGRSLWEPEFDPSALQRPGGADAAGVGYACLT